jgi:hypothetical protein
MVIFFDVGGKKSADPAVLQGVLDVGKVIVQVLSEEARATAWSADAMRAACDRLLEGVSRHLYSRHHSRAPGYQAFQAEWHDELKTRSWWLTFLRALLRRTRPQRAISIGHQLQQLRREAGWSIDELVNQVGLVRSSVYDHLRDTKTPHEDNLKQYEKQFSARLGRPIVIERPRRRREKRTKTD